MISKKKLLKRLAEFEKNIKVKKYTRKDLFNENPGVYKKSKT